MHVGNSFLKKNYVSNEEFSFHVLNCWCSFVYSHSKTDERRNRKTVIDVFKVASSPSLPYSTPTVVPPPPVPAGRNSVDRSFSALTILFLSSLSLSFSLHLPSLRGSSFSLWLRSSSFSSYFKKKKFKERKKNVFLTSFFLLLSAGNELILRSSYLHSC